MITNSGSSASARIFPETVATVSVKLLNGGALRVDPTWEMTNVVAKAVMPVTTPVAAVAGNVLEPLVQNVAKPVITDVVAPVTTPVAKGLVDATTPAATTGHLPSTVPPSTGSATPVQVTADAPTALPIGDVGPASAVSTRPGFLPQVTPDSATTTPAQLGAPVTPSIPTMPKTPGAPAPAAGSTLVASTSPGPDAAAAVLRSTPRFVLALLGRRPAADDHVGVQPGHRPGVSPD